MLTMFFSMESHHRSNTLKVFVFLSFILIPLFISSCGNGGDSDSLPTSFEGVILDTNGLPVADATIFIFDTNEAVIVDENGAFFIESFRHLTSARFYAFIESYTNTVDLESIPEDAVLVRITFRLDRSSNTIEIVSVSFDTTGPIQSSESSVASSADSTSSGSASSSAATSGVSSVAKPTPSPTPTGNFDSNGNTTAFGIPSGLTGNIDAGRSVWNGQCQSCHAREKTGRNYNQIKASFRSIPQMQGLSTSNQQIANVTAYLNRGSR